MAKPTNISFPIVRRVFPSLIAKDLVSVQPMSMPSGRIFMGDPPPPATIDDFEVLDASTFVNHLTL